MKIFNITRGATAASIAGALVVAAIAVASANKPATQHPAAAVADAATLPKFEHVRVVSATPEQMAALAGNSGLATGQRAYIDPATKQLRAPFPEELAAEAAAQPAEASPLVATAPHGDRLANGARRVRLDDSSMSYAVARVEADGSLKQDCLENQPSEGAALKTAATAPGVDRHEK